MTWEDRFDKAVWLNTQAGLALLAGAFDRAAAYYAEASQYAATAGGRRVLIEKAVDARARVMEAGR